MKPIALIVDDEADICRLMQVTLAKMGLDCDIAYNLEMAFNFFNGKTVYDFCLTDLALPDGSGLELVKLITSSNKSMPVAVITAHGTVDLAIEALKLGAFDFVNKPIDLARTRELVLNALKVAKENKQNASTSALSPEDILLGERLIGESEPMNALRATIKKLARSQAPVFLSGGSGTGKEVVAKLIHDLSPRREGSFVPVNCGAIPSELMESEFFGHKKGSFTGATTDKIGLFQQAHGGTLFLDEVADLPLAMQVKLLRAIQEKTVRAIGDTKEVPVDVRILSATHKDLSKLVQTGAFRQDLFYRINVIMVKLPTLNERREDIGMLANHFLQLIANDWQIKLPKLTANALHTLKNHDFKGNVRELRNLLERAVTMTESLEIDTQHLFGESDNMPIVVDKTMSEELSPYQDNRNSYQPNQVTIHTKPANANPMANIKVGTNYSVHKPHEDDVVMLTPDSIPPERLPLPKEGLEVYLKNQEKNLILAALAQANYNKTQAAKLLGMSFRSLRYRMTKLEMAKLNEEETVGDDMATNTLLTDD